MSSTIAPPMAKRSPAPARKAFRQYWEAASEPLAGVLISVGLCWGYLLISIIPALHWWLFMPVAMLGGLLRQCPARRATGPLLPLWGLMFVILLFLLCAVAFQPLTEYGQQKASVFFIGAGCAYLAARRQRPLTAELFRGMRWGLFSSLLFGGVVVYLMRDLFLHQQQLGISALKESVSTVLFPLVLALAATVVIPRTSRPWALWLGGVLLLGGAVLEVFVRSRFHALMLCVLAALLVLGPPWKHIFWRLMLCALLALIGLAVVVNILPLLGDSYLYLTWADPESLAGRAPVWQVALQGFLAHPLGQGFASFESADFFFNYPHNIILEVAYEMGVCGLIAILGIYLCTLRRATQLWLSPPHRLPAACLLLIFGHMLKSGDISSLAFHWIFLYLLFVCTPLAPSWPLHRSKEVA